jgi:hypothetical protein
LILDVDLTGRPVSSTSQTFPEARFGYQDDVPSTSSDLTQWFHDCNATSTWRPGTKKRKTTFKVQHLMSRSPAGIAIQALLTAFAADFVRSPDRWVRERVEQPTRRFETALNSTRWLVRVAAHSPAPLERAAGRETSRFS